MDETDQEKKKEKEPEEIDSDAEEDKSNSIDKGIKYTSYINIIYRTGKEGRRSN